MSESDQTESFGSKIRDLRKAQGLTQRQVAERLRIDFTYLSKLENDRGEAPGEETVRGLAEVFKCDPEELLAAAGRLPKRLRERAREDVAFARFLRQLPDVPPKDISRMQRQVAKKRRGS